MLAGKALQAAERLQLLHEAKYFQASHAQLCATAQMCAALHQHATHSCRLLQLQGLEQQLTGGMTTGEDSAGSWSQMHSSLALQQRMGQLKGQDWPRLQKLLEAMLDLFWSKTTGIPAGPDAEVTILHGQGIYRKFPSRRLPTITDEELSYLTSNYGHVLKYELGRLGYYIESGKDYLTLGIKNCWLPQQ